MNSIGWFGICERSIATEPVSKASPVVPLPVGGLIIHKNSA